MPDDAMFQYSKGGRFAHLAEANRGPRERPAAANRDPYRIDSLTREEAELMAAKLFKALATQAIRDAARGRRNMATATREASQLNHLAIRLEGFADAR